MPDIPVSWKGLGEMKNNITYSALYVKQVILAIHLDNTLGHYVSFHIQYECIDLYSLDNKRFLRNEGTYFTRRLN